jgi:hypothetical protein
MRRIGVAMTHAVFIQGTMERIGGQATNMAKDNRLLGRIRP